MEKTAKKSRKQKIDCDEEASLKSNKKKIKKSRKHETENQGEASPIDKIYSGATFSAHKDKSADKDKSAEHSSSEPGQQSKTAPKKSKVKKSKKHKKAAKEEPSDEAVEDKKESVEKLCLDYLRTWKCNHKIWTFKKVRQVWLLQNMYNCDKIPDEDFETMLEYMRDLKGRARQLTAEKAETLLSSEEDTEKDEKLSETQSERARQVVQLLT